MCIPVQGTGFDYPYHTSTGTSAKCMPMVLNFRFPVLVSVCSHTPLAKYLFWSLILIIQDVPVKSILTAFVPDHLSQRYRYRERPRSAFVSCYIPVYFCQPFLPVWVWWKTIERRLQRPSKFGVTLRFVKRKSISWVPVLMPVMSCCVYFRLKEIEKNLLIPVITNSLATRIF